MSAAPMERHGLRTIARTVLMGAAVWWAGWECGVTFSGLLQGIAKGSELIRFFFPPVWTTFPDLVQPALVTVGLAAAATPIGALLSIPLGIAASHNVAPGWLRGPARSLIALERGLPEIVVLLLLIVAFGLGPFPAVLALSIASTGMLSKLIADAIEEVPPAALDSIACVGASRWQVIRYAILPEILPSLAANTIFRFEVNVRASVLLGAVGAGGLGFELSTAMNSMSYDRATTAILMSLAIVFLSERAADALRKRMFDGGILQ